ncbi:Unknown protein, partial [Striga hermonthica]
EILAAPLPNNFKETNLVYDGSSDPSRHVRTFENMAVLHGYSDSVCCRAFLSTLRGGALDWFHQLLSGSIADFEDLASKLTNQYSSAVAQEKTYLTFMAMKQGEKESLRKYVARYNQTCLEVHSASDEVKAGGLIRILRAGPCRTSLAKTPARSYEDVLKRCRKYINLEEMEMEFAKLEGMSQPEPKKEQNRPRGRSPRRSSPKRSEQRRASPRRRSGDAKREKRDEWQRRPMVKLPVALGSGELRKVRMVRFVVVGAESSYNIIMGRTSLNAFQAVVSTYHMTIKYPVGENVGEIVGDQLTSRSCYQTTVSNNKQLAKRQAELKGEDINRPGGSRSREEKQKVEKGKEKMDIQPGGEVKEIQMIEGCENRKFRIGKDLEEPIRSRLIDLVRKFADIFAYTAEELTGISAEVIEHGLNIDLSVRPVKQKRRHHWAEMDKIIEQEVEKLLGAGHIKEIQFPEWLSNTVMVSKSEGKWRMCIDFRDLNKACPKDLYPLPRIDQLVDSTAGCELLSLMDASQGYHQIPLAREDRKRVSFVTSRGTYCYVFMPFGLKNAGATYQRLVDKIFKEQLGRNMEVYVDDMLVKSREELDHVRDLRETFLTLRRYGMKLNPAKCSFGVRSGKFLGYLVTKRGIEVNPEKVRAVMEMKSPTNVKEVQILAGRIAGLGRFISKVAEKSCPLFRTLKKSAKSQWTEEAQKAFEELRGVLANLPLLAKPVQGEELVLYISIGERAVSSVLLREEGTAQLPIYYVSRVMQGAETRYSEIEKCALAVVVTARKLRPYFLNHKVKVRTNMPLGETLGRPSVSGRLVKWAVELSEYSLMYEPRRAIKAQMLADYIQEGTKVEEESEGLW